jgi:hypothetical protein
VIALRAAQKLDGLPVVNINDVPSGASIPSSSAASTWISRGRPVVLAIPFCIIAALVKLTSKGGVFPPPGADGARQAVHDLQVPLDVR